MISISRFILLTGYLNFPKKLELPFKFWFSFQNFLTLSYRRILLASSVKVTDKIALNSERRSLSFPPVN